MSLKNDLNDVNKMIQFLKFNTPGKNNKNGNPAKTRGSNKQYKVIKYENKFIECLRAFQV